MDVYTWQEPTRHRRNKHFTYPNVYSHSFPINYILQSPLDTVSLLDVSADLRLYPHSVFIPVSAFVTGQQPVKKRKTST